MNKKYNRAPISEVKIGIGLKQPRIPVDSVLKSALLSDEFPILEINQPLSIDILEGFQLKQIMNQNGGPILVRRWSADKRWLVQIQANMIYLNWIRPDNQPVGHYVGFTAVKSKFFSVLSLVEKHLGFPLQSDVDFCELSYLDRFKWQNEIQELSQLNKLMNVSAPPKFSEHGYNNNFSRFTFHDSDVQGFGIININTTTAIDGDQLIRVETNLRGNPIGNLDEWIGRAHAKQHDIFEKLFKEGIKKKWE